MEIYVFTYFRLSSPKQFFRRELPTVSSEAAWLVPECHHVLSFVRILLAFVDFSKFDVYLDIKPFL